MAWIVGLVSQKELEDLRKKGWKDEDPPAAYVSEAETAVTEEDMRTRAFYVDSDDYKIMRLS